MDQQPIKVGLHKIAEHRGKKRLWLEGRSLARIGFTPNARFTVELDLDARTLTLRLSDLGERQVSQRSRGARSPVPIIDILADSLRDVAGVAGRIEAALYAGRIVCRLHPHDWAREEREQRLAQELAAGRLSEGVLCAGGGISAAAMKEGFERSGLQCHVDWVVDREAAYLDAAVDNNVAIATARIFEASLEELDVKYVDPVSVIQMSLPCTGHSPSGKSKLKLRAAEEHPTDALALFGAVRVIEAARPAIIVSENVPQAASSATYALLRGYLQALGYRLFERIMDDREAGTIERRSRWWLVALSEGIADGFDLESLPVRSRRYARLGDAMEVISDDAACWSSNAYLQAKAERDAEAGKGFMRQLVDAESETVGCIGKGYSKRRSTEPMVKRDDGMERLLTPVEHARVKGIPESLIADLPSTLAHEVLGQSILWGHASVLAERIGRHLWERDRPVAAAISTGAMAPSGQLPLFMAA